MPVVHHSTHPKRSSGHAKKSSSSSNRSVQSVIKRAAAAASALSVPRGVRPKTPASSSSSSAVAIVCRQNQQQNTTNTTGKYRFHADDISLCHFSQQQQQQQQPQIQFCVQHRHKQLQCLLALPAPRQMLALPAPRTLPALPAPGRPRIQRVKNWVLQARHCRTRDCCQFPSEASAAALRRFFINMHWQQVANELKLQFNNNNNTTAMSGNNNNYTHFVRYYDDIQQVQIHQPLQQQALTDCSRTKSALFLEMRDQEEDTSEIIEEIVMYSDLDQNEWVVADEEDDDDSSEVEIEWLQLPRDDWELLDEDF